MSSATTMCTWAGARERGVGSRNSLFIHVLDMSELGPAFSYHSFKNLPLDDVIKAEILAKSI